MTFVDTNILLRWLLNDHRQHSLEATKLIDKSPESELLVTDVVVGEVVYVLRIIGQSRPQTLAALKLISDTPSLSYENEELVAFIMKIFASSSRLDFADCYLAARAIRTRKKLATFDKDLQKAIAQFRR